VVLDSSPGRFTVTKLEESTPVLACKPSPGWEGDPFDEGAELDPLVDPDATGFARVKLAGGAVLAGLEVEARVVTGAVACPATAGIVGDTGRAVPDPGSAPGTEVPIPAGVPVLDPLVTGPEADPAPAWVGVDPVPDGDPVTGVDGTPTGPTLSSVTSEPAVVPVPEPVRMLSSSSDVPLLEPAGAPPRLVPSSSNVDGLELEALAAEEPEVAMPCGSVRSFDSEDKPPERPTTTPVKAG
jgi:hypothetical protein